MIGWVLTTVVIRDTPYHAMWEEHTSPLFAAYAKHHGMEYRPQVLSLDSPELLEVTRNSPAPRGTQATFANVNYRRELMYDWAFDGVVFLDSDVVVVEFAHDICETVDDEVPVGTHSGCGVMVTKTNDITRALYDTMWAMRDRYLDLQWLEQAAFMHLTGWSPEYPGDYKEPVWLGPTAWTPYVKDLGEKWSRHPMREAAGDFYLVHPSGLQPFSRRLEFIEQAAAIGRREMEMLHE